jgi:hypothetical protein
VLPADESDGARTVNRQDHKNALGRTSANCAGELFVTRYADLPQVVNAAGNNGALAMLERDVNNIRGTLGRFAPELVETEFAREM